MAIYKENQLFNLKCVDVCSKGSPAAKKKGKEARKWDNAGTTQEGKSLDYSSANGNQTNGHDEEEDLENLVGF